MAEETQRLLFEVLFDSLEAEKRSKALTTDLARLKQQEAETQKEFEKGSIKRKEYDTSMKAIIPQIRNLEKEQRKLQKSIQDEIRLNEDHAGSMKHQKVVIDLLTDSLHSRDAAYLDSKAGKAEIDQLQRLTKEYEKNSEKLNTNKKSVSDLIKEQNVLGVNVGDTIKMFKSGSENAGTFAKGILSTKGAFVALSAVPIILFLTALVSFLTKSQAGMDFMERKTAGLTSVLKSLSNIVVDFGGKIFKAFEEGRAGAVLMDVVITNLTNRFAGFKVIAEGAVNLDWRKVANGFVQVGTGVTDATGKASKFTEELNKTRKTGEAIALESQKIRDAEIQIGVQRAKNRAQIEDLKKISEDTTKSIAERTRASEQAGRLELSTMKATEALQLRKINNIKAEQKQGQITAESNAALAKAQEDYYGMIEESKGKQTELQNQLNSLELEGANKARAARAKVVDEQIAEQNRYLVQARRNREETITFEENLIKLQAKRDAMSTSADDKKGRQELLLIEAKAQADLAELRINKAIETDARILGLKESAIKTLLAKVKEGTLAELELNKALIDTEAEGQRDQARATIRNKQLQDARIRQIDAETKRKLLDAEKAFILRQFELAQQRAELQQRAADQLLNRFNQDQKSRIGIAQDTAATMLANAKEGSKEEFEARLQMIEANRNAELQSASESGLKGVELQKRFDKINAEADRAASDERIRRRNEEVDKIQSRVQAGIQVLTQFMDAQDAARMKRLDDQQKAELNSAGLSAEMRESIQAKYDKKREAAEKEAAERRRKLALVETVIATAAGVAKAIPNPFLIALALATGLAQVATIESQQFARGGVVDGPSHAAGGVKYMGGRVELEGGEGVINKQSMALPWVRRMASQLNQVGGGVAFDGASSYRPTYRMEYGGIVPPNATTSGIDYATLGRTVAEAMKQMPAPIVGVDDIRAGIGRVVNVEQSADFGNGKK